MQHVFVRSRHIQLRPNSRTHLNSPQRLGLPCVKRAAQQPPVPSMQAGAVAEDAQGAGLTFSAACARPHVAATLRNAYQDLVAQWPAATQLPFVYHNKYNISFFGIEKLHPFDSCKFRKVVDTLVGSGLVTLGQLVTPKEATREMLGDVHTPTYLEEIHTSNLKVVQVTELPPLFMLPNKLLQWRVVTPMKYHVGGTMLAAALAVERGWAVNLGGGMHHAYASNGMGWCPFDDVTLAVRRLRAASGGRVQRVLYVDLDAHQGNGVERDKLLLKDQDLYIVDVYNGRVFPADDEARPAINVDIPLPSGTTDEAYLRAVRTSLTRAASEFPAPDLVFYNAGTDVLEKDPLGRLGVSQGGVLARDEMVWDYALTVAKAPIVMTLSGGYTAASAPTIAMSLLKLMRKYGLGADAAGAGAAAEEAAAAAAAVASLVGGAAQR